MLGTKEIELVMIRVCESLRLVPLSRIYLPDDFPEGPAETSIVIHVKKPTRGDIFYKGFVEVNVVIPDDNDRAEHELLTDAERVLEDAFKYDTCGEFKGNTYRYGLHSISVLHKPESHYHYVNAELTFESLNI